MKDSFKRIRDMAKEQRFGGYSTESDALVSLELIIRLCELIDSRKNELPDKVTQSEE